MKIIKEGKFGPKIPKPTFPIGIPITCEHCSCVFELNHEDHYGMSMDSTRARCTCPGCYQLIVIESPQPPGIGVNDGNSN